MPDNPQRRWEWGKDCEICRDRGRYADIELCGQCERLKAWVEAPLLRKIQALKDALRPFALEYDIQHLWFCRMDCQRPVSEDNPCTCGVSDAEELAADLVED